MKRLKPVRLKTTVLGKGGRKRKLSVPLTILRNEAESQSSGESTCTRVQLESTDDIVSKNLFRKTNSFLNWTECRENIFNAFLESSAMLDGANCVVCHERSASIRCLDCGPLQVFCEKCSSDLHLERNQFHVLELWQEDRFIPLYPDHGVIGYGHKCPTQLKKPFTLIDFYGRHHLKYVEICNCESAAATLVRLNFWPGSPEKPSVAFHMNLMRLCEKLFLQCHVSLFNFVEVLKALQLPLHPTLVSSIYSILNSGCFEEFRHFQYRCKYFTNTDNGSICPLCPEDNGTVIESMDACMGLARKRSKGTQKGQQRHSLLFFSDQSDVDHFVDNYASEGTVIEKDCSRFHAGEVLSSLRSKGKNKIFEEKGVFGRVCRHDYPKHFLNLKYGERISYSVYELQKLKRQFMGKNVSVIVMYDIACILEKHLKNTKQGNLLDGIGLSIPIFHCYGHKASCQIKYSPRRLEGVGLTDGEGVERLWSYLRDFSRMTKEMSPDKRTDVLTDALLYYGERLREKFGVSLKGKLSRAESLLSETNKKIKDLSRSIPVTQQKLEEWQAEELASIIPQEKVLELEWHERYVDLLLENKRLRNELVYVTYDDQQKVEATQKKKTSNERSLAAIEKKQRVGKRWKETDDIFQDSQKSLVQKKKGNLLLKMQKLASERWFLLEMKKKYADGQSIAVKLSKQISKVTNHIRGNLLSYNELEMTNPLQFDDVKDALGVAYCKNASMSEQCPTSIKRQLVDLLCMKKRSEEEIELLKKEMIQLLSFHLSQINYIEDCMKPLSDTLLDKGMKALLSAKKLALELNHSRVEQLWQNLHISPYHWKTVVYCASVSNDPLFAMSSTDQENESDVEDVNSESGDESNGDVEDDLNDVSLAELAGDVDF